MAENMKVVTKLLLTIELLKNVEKKLLFGNIWLMNTREKKNSKR